MRRIFLATALVILSAVSANAQGIRYRQVASPNWDEFISDIQVDVKTELVRAEVQASLDWQESVRGVLAAEAFARYLTPPAPAPMAYTATQSVSRPTSGGHSDAWWHGVAQCEQGGRNDPYFGYFSFMDGSAGGKSWDEQVAMGNSVLSRVSSESPAWAPSCVAMGYQYSPGG